MATLTVRDDALWSRHIGDPSIRRKVDSLSAGEAMQLRIDGHPIRFRKMADGRDGRRTPGLKADPDDAAGRAAWTDLQRRRGEEVSLTLDEHSASDPYLAHLDKLFHEWNSPEDAAAFDGL